MVRDTHHVLKEAVSAFESSYDLGVKAIAYEEKLNGRIEKLECQVATARKSREQAEAHDESVFVVLKQLSELRLRPVLVSGHQEGWDWRGFCEDLGKIVHQAEVLLGMDPPALDLSPPRFPVPYDEVPQGTVLAERVARVTAIEQSGSGIAVAAWAGSDEFNPGRYLWVSFSESSLAPDTLRPNSTVVVSIRRK